MTATTICAPTDAISFFRAWLSDPLRVASITPSGAALSNAITSEITPAYAPVIELGPGTGVFTRALIARGVPEEKLALIEFGSDFARRLEFRHPSATVLWMDASKIGDVPLFGGDRAGAVVSGLPLLSRKPRKVMAILRASFRHLRENGAFYQFTYGPRCPVRRPILDRLGLEATYLTTAFANIPLASVYRITRKTRS